MISPFPPAAGDEAAYISVEYRDKEGTVIEQIAARLAPEHVLSARIDGDDLVVAYRGTEHRLPRIVMPAPDGLWYDCVSVYSLTELLHADYRIFVRTPWREDATDRLLVVPVEQAQAWRSPPST